jgi:tetratricopeptide (TPR) repeat protein
VFHAYQQMHTEYLLQKPNQQYLDVTIEAATLLLKILEADPQNARIGDKQNEYLFERETTETVDAIAKLLERMTAATPENVIRHPRQGFESKSGIMSSAETCGPKASTVFHLLNEPDLLLLEQEADQKAKQSNSEKAKHTSFPAERRRLLTMTCQQLEETPAAINAQVRVIVVSGSVGVGKSHYALHLSKVIEDRFKGDQSFQKFHIRLRSNTEFPMTHLEAKQNVIKMWHVGTMPVRNQKEVDELYNRTFYGKTSVLLLEDVSSLKQALELIPNVRQSVRSQVYIIMETRTSSLTQSHTNLDKIVKYTTGQVDFLDTSGFINKKGEAQEAKLDDLISEHDDSDEDTITDDDEDELVGEVHDGDDKFRSKQTKELNKQMEKIFGKTKRKTVSVTLIDDEEENLDEEAYIEQMANRMPHFYALFVNLGKLTLEGSTELVVMGNKRTVAESVRTLGVLLDNVPIFLKIVGRTHFLYLSADHHTEKLSTSEMVRYISTQVDEVANRSNYTRIRQLCHGSFIGCFRKWPEHIRKIVLMLTVFPNSFDVVSAALITKTPLSKMLIYLFELVQVGILYALEPMRYAYHDLARETYSAHLYEAENSDSIEEVDDCKKRYLQHYYDLMKRVNMEHQFSGIEFMPGVERYDLELENMKSVMNFMQENETDHIEAINRSRYILRHRVFAMQRGMLYQHLSKFFDDIQNPFTQSEFLEGFTYVYLDLTDYQRGFAQASRALELKEDAVTMSDDPTKEIELLSVLQILGDLNMQMNQFDKAKEFYERMIDIAQSHAKPWQKQKLAQPSEGFENDDSIIVDTFLGHAQKSMAIICLTKGDIAGGRKFFERGVSVMKCVLCSTHPELSESYAKYAATLTKFKAKQFFDEICRLFEQAIAIDTALFGDKSVIVGDRMNEYGAALLSMSRYPQAEEYFRKALIIRQKNYGTKDMTVAATTNNLAVACKNVGKLDESEKLYRRALETTVEIMGEKDPLVSIARANLAQTLSTLGKAEEAKELYKMSLDEMSQGASTAEDAATMATMLQQMGDNARKQENFVEALKYFEQALAIRKQITTNEANDPDIAKTLSSIAQLYFDEGRFEECEKILTQSIDIIEGAYGKKHPAYNAALTSFANSKFKQNRFAEAESLFKESLQLKKDSGETPYQLLGPQQSLAVTFDATKKYDEALALWREILKTVESSKPVDKAKMKQVLYSIATDLTKKNKFKEALEVYQRIEKVIVEESGDNDLDYGHLVYNMGACQLSFEAFDDAELSFAKAYQIYLDKFGEDHEKTIEANDMLSEIRRLIYERDNATKCCGGCSLM